MSDEQRIELAVPPDHPSLPGHFPGNPIVPGVVLLDLVVAAIRGTRTLRLLGIPNLKFLQVVRPGAPFTLRWTWRGDQVRFRCTGAAGDHVQGALSFTGDTG